MGDTCDCPAALQVSILCDLAVVGPLIDVVCESVRMMVISAITRTPRALDTPVFAREGRVVMRIAGMWWARDV